MNTQPNWKFHLWVLTQALDQLESFAPSEVKARDNSFPNSEYPEILSDAKEALASLKASLNSDFQSPARSEKLTA